MKLIKAIVRPNMVDNIKEALGKMNIAGMTVTELSAAEQAKLRDKLKPVIDKHGAAIAATVAELQAELTHIWARKLRMSAGAMNSRA